MVKTVNKRRFEELEDCNTLHVKGIRADPNYLKSEEFKNVYLKSPCNCCGSKGHSLLGIKNQLKTRNNRIQYEYTCPVAGHEDIDRIDKRYPSNELTISFWLDSEKYANECQFSPTIARGKFKELEDSITAGYEVIMNRFKDNVIEVCQENTELRMETKRRKRETLNREKDLLFRDIFLTKPCRICGEKEHSVLQTFISDGGVTQYKYECPSALTDDYEAVKHKTIRCRLQICPIRYARACGYDKKKVFESHKRVVEQQGDWMKGKASWFLETALAYCNNLPHHNNYKRTRSSSG